VKFLVLGAGGQVGFELLRALATCGQVTAATRSGLLPDETPCVRADLAQTESLIAALDDARPDVVVNAAAYTAVDRAEDEADLADRINHRAVAEIGAWAARSGARVVHYSTDYVFDGTAKQPYREDDATAPLGVYGRSKLAGEHALRASGAQHLILRTAWVYAARGHNFLRTMLRVGAERDALRVVDDQVGAPTPARTIAGATASALERWIGAGAAGQQELAGTYHLTAHGCASWYEFATAIFEGAATRGLIRHTPRVQPIATADYPTRARRPAYSVLDCSRFEKGFGIQLPEWRSGLGAVLDQLAR
jgi:dTDP-4-dehydrorhamnose reductase